MRASALNGPSPNGGDTYFSHAPGQHGSLPSPNRRASALSLPGPNRSSLRRPLILLATGTFAIGTDAFVIGGILPAVAARLTVRKPAARSAGTGSAGQVPAGGWRNKGTC